MWFTEIKADNWFLVLLEFVYLQLKGLIKIRSRSNTDLLNQLQRLRFLINDLKYGVRVQIAFINKYLFESCIFSEDVQK